jgi:hypothetical protein
MMSAQCGPLTISNACLARALSISKTSSYSSIYRLTLEYWLVMLSA